MASGVVLYNTFIASMCSTFFLVYFNMDAFCNEGDLVARNTNNNNNKHVNSNNKILSCKKTILDYYKFATVRPSTNDLRTELENRGREKYSTISRTRLMKNGNKENISSDLNLNLIFK